MYFMGAFRYFSMKRVWLVSQGKYCKPFDWLMHTANQTLYVINILLSLHCSKYLSEYSLPENIVATTSASEALAGADFCFHAVPVQVLTVLYEALWFAGGFLLFSVWYFSWQFSSSFLGSISTYVDPKLPFISLSKGLELNTLRTMSQIIPLALGNPRQPFIVLSGPSFAVELMEKLPTG